MPRHPDVAPNIAAMAGSVYTSLAHRLATYEGEIYPFHVGDTWMEPAVGCRMQDLTVEDHPGMHRYAAPQGIDPLIAAIAETTQARTGVATGPDNVLVAAGATGALGAVAGAQVEVQHVGFHELGAGVQTGPLGQLAGALNGPGREVHTDGRAHAAPDLSQRVHSEMALEVEERAAFDVAEPLRIQCTETSSAGV